MDNIATDYSVDLSVTSNSINARSLVLLPTLGSSYAKGTSGHMIHSFYYLLRRALHFLAIAHRCRKVHYFWPLARVTIKCYGVSFNCFLAYFKGTERAPLRCGTIYKYLFSGRGLRNSKGLHVVN